MSLLLALDWNHDVCGVVAADVAAGRVTVQHLLQLPWPAAVDRETDPVGMGVWLREQLNAAGINADQAVIVLPREDVVTRRLELPEAPDEELPELVRFQAATRSATPLDQLVLDFVPLPRVAPEGGRPALLATIELTDLERLKKICEAAELELLALRASPFTVSEVAARAERQHGDDPNATTLIVFQGGTRVELSILQQLGLVFTHQTRVSPGDDRSLRGTMAEINRSIVTLGQMMHTTIEVERVCLIHDADVDPGLEQALAERFAGKLQVIEPSADTAVSVTDADLSRQLAALTPAVGALLSQLQPTVPAIDFLSPRRPPPKKDVRRERMIRIGAASGVAAALLALIGWLYSRSLDAQIRALQIQDGELTTTLQKAQEPLAAHERLRLWQTGSVRPLTELDRLNRLLPGTDRVLLLNVQVQPPKGDAFARITAVGIAKTPRDISDLFDTLTTNGYRVEPRVNDVYKLDPDYPHKFTLDVTRLPTPPAPSPSPG